MAAIKAWMHTVSAFVGRVPNSFATATIGTATTANGWMVFVPPVNMTVTKVAFYVVSTTGVLGSDLIKASIQTISQTSRGFAESGRPSGTIVGTSATVAANTMNVAAINAITGLSATLTAGTPYALVIEPNATWSGTSTMVIRIALNDTSTNNVYLINGWYAGITTNVSGTAGFPVLLFGTSTDWYGHPCPDALPANQNIANPGAGSTYMQTAIKFTVPSTITSCKVDRAVLQNIRYGWGSASVIYRIMDSTGTTSLQATTATTDAFTHTTQTHSVLDVQFTGTKATLTGGTTYLFVVESQSGSVEQYTMDIDLTYQNALFNAFADLANGEFIYRTGTSGLWTQVTTFKRMNPLSLQLSDIVTAGGSGGGMVVHPGMSGGMRG
jgi:hypothetical protein